MRQRHRVDLGRETLVGQGLPRGQHGDARNPRGRALVSDSASRPRGREDDEGRGRARGDGREQGAAYADGCDDRARTAGFDGVDGRLDRGIGGDVREESGE